MGFKEFDENDYRHMPVDKDEQCVKCILTQCLKIPEAQQLVSRGTYESHTRLECIVASVTQDHCRESCPKCVVYGELREEDCGGMDPTDDKNVNDILYHRLDDRIDQVNSELRERLGFIDGHRSLAGYDADPYAAHDWSTRKRMADLGTPLPPRRSKVAEDKKADLRAEILEMRKEGLI